MGRRMLRSDTYLDRATGRVTVGEQRGKVVLDLPRPTLVQRQALVKVCGVQTVALRWPAADSPLHAEHASGHCAGAGHALEPATRVCQRARSTRRAVALGTAASRRHCVAGAATRGRSVSAAASPCWQFLTVASAQRAPSPPPSHATRRASASRCPCAHCRLSSTGEVRPAAPSLHQRELT